MRLPRAAPDPDGKSRGAFEPARKPTDIPDPGPQDRGAFEPSGKPTDIPDPGSQDRGGAQPARPAKAGSAQAVPRRGAFEPSAQARALSKRSPVPPVLRSTPELAGPSSPARGERSALPAVPQGAPGSAAKAPPSWATVLATTVRLWVRRRRIPILLALALVLAAAGGLAFALSRHGPRPADPQPGAAAGSGVVAAAAIRSQTAGWVARQVNHDATVACDPVMCVALHSRGFPAANLVPILPARPDPLGAELIVATAALRNQFGARLAAVYAPQVIARFGTGPARIEIRTIPPEGTVAFRRRLGSAERAARKQGAQLLSNRQIITSSEAGVALASGRVDGRLLATLATLAEQHPLLVIAFGDANPGAGPAIPLRSADLAGADQAAGLSAAAYQHWLLGFLHAQRAAYRATSVTVGRVAGGGTVVQIEFAAPSM